MGAGGIQKVPILREDILYVLVSKINGAVGDTAWYSVIDKDLIRSCFEKKKLKNEVNCKLQFSSVQILHCALKVN